MLETQQALQFHKYIQERDEDQFIEQTKEAEND